VRHFLTGKVIKDDLGSSSRSRVHLALATESSGNVDKAAAVSYKGKRQCLVMHKRYQFLIKAISHIQTFAVSHDVATVVGAAVGAAIHNVLPQSTSC
jgi:hypothetical protein